MSEFYSHQDAERRRKIKEDLSYQKLLSSFCCTEEEKYEHLDYCHANDQAYLKRLGYKLAVRGIDRHKIDHPDFLSRTISGLGINETGGLYCNSYFVIGDFYRDVRASIKNLFNSYVHGKDAMQKYIVFLNFIWYQDNIPFLTIHTDLKYAELDLDERQYGKFQNLGIKHTKK